MERWREKKIERKTKRRVVVVVVGGGGVNSKQIDLTQFTEQNLASLALPALVHKNPFSFPRSC